MSKCGTVYGGAGGSCDEGTPMQGERDPLHTQPPMHAIIQLRESTACAVIKAYPHFWRTNPHAQTQPGSHSAQPVRATNRSSASPQPPA